MGASNGITETISEARPAFGQSRYSGGCHDTQSEQVKGHSRVDGGGARSGGWRGVLRAAHKISLHADSFSQNSSMSPCSGISQPDRRRLLVARAAMQVERTMGERWGVRGAQ